MQFKPVYAIAILFLAAAAFIGFITISDRRAAAERKVKEEKLTAEILNQQQMRIQKATDDFEQERQRAAREREFNLRLYGSSEKPPEVVQRDMERHLRKLAEAATQNANSNR